MSDLSRKMGGLTQSDFQDKVLMGYRHIPVKEPLHIPLIAYKKGFEKGLSSTDKLPSIALDPSIEIGAHVIIVVPQASEKPKTKVSKATMYVFSPVTSETMDILDAAGKVIPLTDLTTILNKANVTGAKGIASRIIEVEPNKEIELFPDFYVKFPEYFLSEVASSTIFCVDTAWNLLNVEMGHA